MDALSVGVVDARWSGGLLGGSLRRLAITLTGLALCMLALSAPGGLPSLRVDFGGDARSVAATPSASATKPSFDVERVIDPLRHEVRPLRDGSDQLGVGDARYQARFGSDGFALHLPRAVSAPAAGPTPSLTVSLTGLTRGADSIALGGARWTADGNVSERRVAPGITERVTSRNGEVEWDVVLASPPGTGGDLRVQANVGGNVTAVRRTTTELLFTVAGRPFTMGELIVKDASGRELHRALPTMAGGVLSLEVPDSVLQTARYPLVLDPTVTAPFTVADAAEPTSQPDVAWDGTHFAVVWEEAPGTFFLPTIIKAALLLPDGTVVASGVLDALPLGPPACKESRDPAVSTVVSGGSPEFVFTWQSRGSVDPGICLSSLGLSSLPYSIYMHVGGITSENHGWLSCPILGAGVRADVSGTNAADGLITWENGGNIWARRFAVPTPGSCQSIGNAFQVTTDGFTQRGARVTTSSLNDWLVVWEHETQLPVPPLKQIYGARVGRGGEVNASLLLSPGTDETEPDIGNLGPVGGDRWLVVWRSGSNLIRGTTLVPTGVNPFFGVETTPFTVGGGTEAGIVTAPRVGENPPTHAPRPKNGRWLVAWHKRRSTGVDLVEAARVTSAGQVMGSTSFVVDSSGSTAPAVSAAPDDDFGVVYAEIDNIYLRTVSPK